MYIKNGKLYQNYEIHWAYLLYKKVTYYIEICIGNEY